MDRLNKPDFGREISHPDAELPDTQILEQPEALPETLEGSYEGLINGHAPVNFGKEALIFYLNQDEFSPAVTELYQKKGRSVQDSAVKVLKVYAAGNAEREFSAQAQAYDIIETQIAQHPDQADQYARVPTPVDHRTFAISEETRQRLNDEGAALGNKVEVLVMDFIHGDDLATTMYKWVLEHCPEDKEYLLQNVRPDNFKDLQDAISKILEFEKPAGAANEEERLAKEWKLNMLNAKKVYAFLKKSGFKVSDKVIDQIRNTRRLLEKHGLYHNDEHERNYMIEGDQVFLIDFARAGDRLEASEVHFEHELEQMTDRYNTKKAEEGIKEQKDNLVRIANMASADSTVQLYESVVRGSGTDSRRLAEMVTNRGIASTSSEKSLEGFMSLLVKLTKEKRINRQQALSVIEGVKKSMVRQERKGRQMVTRISNQYLYNRMDYYSPLFN